MSPIRSTRAFSPSSRLRRPLLLPATAWISDDPALRQLARVGRETIASWHDVLKKRLFPSHARLRAE